MEGAVDLGVSPSPPEATRRRSVQTKLCFGIPKSDGENVKEIGEIEAGKVAESPKKRRGRPPKPKPEASIQAPVVNKAEGEIKSTNNNEVAEEAEVETRGRRRAKSELSAKSPNSKRGRPRSDTPSKDGDVEIEDSPGKRQKRGVKVVPSRKRCKALESISEGVEGPSLDSHRELTVDLRSEAKMASQENSRLSAGKQMHPFFSSRMTNKRAPETTADFVKGEDKSFISPQEKGLSPFPPIHVHDSTKYDSPLDWGRWTFKEAPSLDKSHLRPPETSCSVFQDSVKPLTLESCLSEEIHHYQFSVTPIAIPDIKLSSELETVDDESNSIFPPSSSFLLTDLTKEDKFGICSESCQRDSSLWTNKYSPENASQVCGNSESVSFLSEWLKGWHERGRKSNKTSKIIEEISEDSSCSWYKSESDTDDLIEESDLWNALLITGPVGSGKSAAVYACAKEQGFNIVEVNASDVRNGAHVKQKFGEATESHGLGKWSREEILVSSTPDVAENDGRVMQVAVNKTLVLFEDADTVFEEDRGFISTILQLADSTKWPIVLTSNNKKPVLPRPLSRLVLEFSRPSSEELLLHVQKICALEKAGIPIPIMNHAINYCLSDIRRTIMLLQFWCQGRKKNIGNQGGTCSLMPLDMDAMHSAIPVALPHEFPCELSEKICNEINQAISSIEEDRLQKELQYLEFLSPNRPSPCKPKKPNKRSKLKKNQSILESSELEPCSSELNDFSDVPNTPIPTVKQNSKNKRALVMSDSDEEPCTDHGTVDNTTLSQTFTPLEFGILIDNAMDSFDCNGAATPSHVCDTFISVIPESPYASKCETVSMKGNTSCFDWPSVDTNVDAPSYLYTETHANVGVATGNNFAMDECSSAGFYLKGSSSRPIQSVQDTWNSLRNRREELNACMRSDSKMSSQALKAAHRFVDLISETDVLVTGHNPLIYALVAKVYQDTLSTADNSSSYEVNGTNYLIHCVMEIAIEEHPVMLNKLDTLDQSLSLSEEPDDISSYDMRLEMASVYAQHGLGIYMDPCVVRENRSDVANTMLACSSNSAAIGRLLTSCIASEAILEGGLARENLRSSLTLIKHRQQESSLYNALFPIVPPKMVLSLRGPPFHEYLSSTSQISKFEFSRLSQNESTGSSRRSHQSRHYLTSGKLQLSTEEAELLARYCSYDTNTCH